MNAYEAISARRSVRKFKMEALPTEFFRNFRKFEHGLIPLFPDTKFSIEIYNLMDHENKLKGAFCVKAPYVFAVFVEKGQDAAVNGGYLAEQLVLYLTGHGVGTCYQGGAKLLQDEAPEGMELVILIAFGPAENEVYREAYQARRLPLKQLCVWKEESTEETRLMLQAARLAPSAFNGQPWRFMAYQNRIHVFIKKETLPIRRISQKMLETEMGIMLAHMSVAAEEVWRDLEFARGEQIAEKEWKNNDYFLTVLLV